MSGKSIVTDVIASSIIEPFGTESASEQLAHFSSAKVRFDGLRAIGAFP
jgi:hypothetical protein